MSHYKIGLTGPTHLPQRITTAYRAVGKEAPTDLDALTALLGHEPSAHQLGVTLAGEAVTLPADQAQEWTEQAIARMTRALAADEVRKAVNGHRTHALTRNGRTLVARAIDALADDFTAAATRLADLAAELPTGSDALEVGAVMASDSTKAYRQTGETLATLSALGAIVDGGSGGSTILPVLRDLLRVVDVPEVPVAQVDRMSGRALDTSEARDRVRAMAKDARDRSADEVLIEVARGTYGEDITLSWATSATVLAERVRRVTDALSAHRVDSWGHKAKNAPAPEPANA